ncbi:MAG: hypothetical protein ACD_17C00004G0001, partial [uncultured bacterium]
CMEAYQQAQRHRKVRIRVGRQLGAECLLIGQKNESLFPNMRVRHGVHIQDLSFLILF